MRESSIKKWTALLEAFKNSNKSARRWCLEEGISYQAFILWKNRLQAPSKTPSFVELKSPTSLEIRYGEILVSCGNFQDLKILKDLLAELC